jgi:two-component system, LytTR family, response regulator
LPVSAQKIRTVIVDDEPLARSNVRVLLQRDSTIDVVAECGSGPDAPALIRRIRPDLLFLDVQMPECDGFDVLELVGTELPLAIVFVTAYDQYALRAFEAGALDYLLKPFDNARFDLALSRAKYKVELGKDHPRKLDRLAIKSAGQIAFINLSEIDWIEAADYYCCLHVAAKSFMLRETIKQMTDTLDPRQFVRIHRSTIVNVDRVREIFHAGRSEGAVVLHNGTRLRMSRRGWQTFLAVHGKQMR